MHKQISSLQNPIVKQFLLLSEKARERKKTGLFIIEGKREIQLAIKGGFAIGSLLYCPTIITSEELSEVQNNSSEATELIEVTQDIYSKIAYRGSTEGVIAIAQSKELSLSTLALKPNPLILVAEAPEKPGNIGALLRTADAANLDAVIIANPKTDIYNPNIIRSSIGCVFTTKLATGTTKEIIDYLKEKNIAFYSATLQTSVPYIHCDFTTASAIVVGTESTGLTQAWRDACTENIMIPMQGEIDSMNVSVAAGILIFEAKRQRGF